MQLAHRNQTDRLRALIGAAVLAAPAGRNRIVANLDTIGGRDEMQGYPRYPSGPNVQGFIPGTMGYPVVGLGWGDLGHAANLAFNPLAQAQATYHALQGGGRGFWGGGGAPAQAHQAPPMWMPPPAPMLPPGAGQAAQHGAVTLLAYMGLGLVSWVSTDTLTTKPISAEPQAAFRGRRLVIDVAKTTGANGILTTVSQPLTVSGMPQTPAPQQPAPTAMFSPATTYSMLDLQIAVSGTQINLGVSVSAIPASGETVVVAAGLYGEWMR